MKIYIDRDRVNARAMFANAASVGGLLVLLLSVLLPLLAPPTASLSLGLLAMGGITAMIGIYMANRWVRKPRPEDSLAKALKALDDRYCLYLYPRLPCDHVLLTPAGPIALEIVNLAGGFSFRKGRWKEAMTMGRALRYIVEPRVGDPNLVAADLQARLGARLRSDLGPDWIVPLRALTVFTHPDTELEIEGASFPGCRIEKLRKQVTISGPPLTSEAYETLASWLERATLP